MKHVWKIVVGFVVLLIVVAACNSAKPVGSGGVATSPSISSSSGTSYTIPTVAVQPTGPAMTTSQAAALREAKSYLDYSGFSRKGLIRQLTSTAEGFSKADAEFAVGQLTVDWKEEAAQKAKSYMDYSGFSRAGLIRQLTSTAEGFTKDEATYAADSVGLK